LLQGSPQRRLSNQMSFARHSSLTDLTQRSAYEFKFGLLAGKRIGFTLPDSISSRVPSGVAIKKRAILGGLHYEYRLEQAAA